MKLPVALQQILNDNLSGSVTLLKRLMTALENELLDPELDPSTFISYVEHFRNKMEMFTVVRHFCDELILSHNISVRHYPANYLQFISDYREFWEHVPDLLKNNLLKSYDLRKKTIMVHSNSGTIREVFRLMADQQLDIHFLQTLSAPVEEGRIQALDLAKMGYKVTLIPDALAGEKMKNTDYLILAADQVREKTIVNKVGSLQMVLAANEFAVPVLLLTESRKLNLAHNENPFEDKPRDPNEILLDLNHTNISAENRYLEEVPRFYISRIITERKILDSNE